MKRSARKPSRAYRFGYFWGTATRRYASFEATTTRPWLSGKGINPALCNWLLLIPRLTLIGLSLYVLFWVAVVYLGVLALQALAELDAVPVYVVNDENGWRDGPAGFGYYCGDCRVDGGRYENQEQEGRA